MNMHTLTFDKLAYLDRLKGAGVTDEVARAHAEGLDQALRESIATKADVEALGRDLTAQFEAADRKLDQKIDGVEKQLEAKIDGVEKRLEAKIDGVEKRLEAKIDEAEKRLDAKVDGLEKRLGVRIDEVDKRFDGLERKFDFFQAGLAASVSELKAQIAEGHTALMRWMIGTVFAAIGLLWAMLHYVR